MNNSKRKKRILFHSDFAFVKTGFGRAMKILLSYLYKTGKYEIHHLCCGIPDNAKELSLTPWKSHGSVTTDQQKSAQIAQNEAMARAAHYGSGMVDEVVKKVKPDIYIGVQDFWGLDYCIEKDWFNKITSCLWITLDSLPILPSALKNANKIKNYWVWSNFAEKEMAKQGFNHVRTVHGPIDASKFYRLSEEKRSELRNKFNLPQDSVIIGFVFRNQLRKLVPNLMEGYKLWKDRNPQIKNSYLLLHTNFSEGWNIKAQADIHGVDTKEILTTYICQKCGEFEVKSFDDRKEKFLKKPNGEFEIDQNGKKIEVNLDPQNKSCRYCGTANSQITTNVAVGVTEEQLNEVYNLMDVYVHPFTSGGQEIPIQEAKLTELVTLVTNYSCGEECCEPEAASLPLEWSKYIEHGTEFIKASTNPVSIADQLDYFLSLSSSEKSQMGAKARSWVLEKFSIDTVGSQISSFIDSAPFVDIENEENFEDKNKRNRNPGAYVDKTLPSNLWVKSLYKEILGSEKSEDDEGYLYWMNELSKNTPREQIENYFRQVAQKEKAEFESANGKAYFEDFIKDKEKKKILYVMPRSIGDCFLSTAIFPSLREIYSKEEWDLYVSSLPDYKDVFQGNENITAWIPYSEAMENHMLMEGIGDHKGWFDICFTPHISTQKSMNYIHNGINKLLM